MESTQTYSPEFFTPEDMKQLKRFSGTPRDKSNNTHNETYEYLRKVYEKIEYWASQVQKEVFPKGDYKLIRKPIDRALQFTPYLWARIYPSLDAPKKLPFTIEINAEEDGFIIKIDTYSLREDPMARERYEKYRGDWNNSVIVKRIDFKSSLKGGWSELIKLTSTYFKSIESHYYELLEITRIGLSEQSSIPDIQKKKIVTPVEPSEVLEVGDLVVREVTEGVIGVRKLAKVMADVLRNLNDDKGKMVGIFGNWGRGKTLLFKEIWQQLKNENQFELVEFHAWKFQDTPASWAYLYEAFAKQYHKVSGSNWWIREWRKLKQIKKLNDVRVTRKEIVKAIFVLIVSLAGVLIPWLEGWFVTSLLKTSISLTPAILLVGSSLWKNYKNWFENDAKALFKKYYTNVSYNKLLGVQAEIQHELKMLLTAWFKNAEPEKRILLFVDDIDRCSEDKIITIIDALKVMLEDDEISKRVIVLAAIDDRVLKRAIKCKYHDLITKDFSVAQERRDDLTQTLASEYIDKLFLIGLHLGSLTTNEKEEILANTIKKSTEPLRNDTLKQENAGNKPKGEYSVGDAEDDDDENETDTVRESPSGKTGPSAINGIKSKEAINPITEREKEHLKKLMKHYPGMTPRQIRIFYYRYLLAKKILSIQQEGEYKITTGALEEMADLLMHFTTKKNKEEIVTAKNTLIVDDKGNTTQTIFGNSVTFNADAYRLYLQTLETVIAY